MGSLYKAREMTMVNSWLTWFLFGKLLENNSFSTSKILFGYVWGMSSVLDPVLDVLCRQSNRPTVYCNGIKVSEGVWVRVFFICFLKQQHILLFPGVGCIWSCPTALSLLSQVSTHSPRFFQFSAVFKKFLRHFLQFFP